MVDQSILNQVPKMLQEIIIQYSYKKISAALKQDCGLFSEGHPFADSIPKTMWAEEAILMPELVANNATGNCIKYCDTLRSLGIKSNSWGYLHEPTVYDGRLAYCNKKEDVILKCKLTQLAASSLKQL